MGGGDPSPQQQHLVSTQVLRHSTTPPSQISSSVPAPPLPCPGAVLAALLVLARLARGSGAAQMEAVAAGVVPVLAALIKGGGGREGTAAAGEEERVHAARLAAILAQVCACVCVCVEGGHCHPTHGTCCTHYPLFLLCCAVLCCHTARPPTPTLPLTLSPPPPPPPTLPCTHSPPVHPLPHRPGWT